MHILEKQVLPKCPICLDSNIENETCLDCGLSMKDSDEYQIPIDLNWYAQDIDKFMNSIFKRKRI